MRTILAMAAMVLLASTPSAARSGETPGAESSVKGGVADPAARVREIYDPAAQAAFDGAAAEEAAGDGRHSQNPLFSPRLRALFLDDEIYADGQVGRLDFNPFSGGNDDDVQAAEVAALDVDGAPDRRIVVARFRNMNAEQTVTYFWERIDGLWYIDDITGRTAGEPTGWALSLGLKYGHWPI